MYNRDDITSNAAQAGKSLRSADTCTQAVGEGSNPNYRSPSMAELHGKSAAHHADQVDKNTKAQAFFASHPEFDEFIQLIRQGAIQI